MSAVKKHSSHAKNGKQQVLAVIGLGYVGLPLALLADKKGYKVIGFDLDKKKIDLINKREPIFNDEKISQDIKNTGITGTSDPSSLKKANIIVVCVPTPVYKNHIPDLRPLVGAAESIGRNIRKGQEIIIESTVNPGVSEGIVLPIIRQFSNLKNHKDFYFSYCPERINPGDDKWNIENIPRVIGSLNEEGLKRAMDFYGSIIKADIKPMANIKEAEAVKIVENSFRDINIAFVNELAMSFSRMNIDVVNVIKGASTKPFGFLPHFPGCGVGGHCIPVDPYYLIEHAKRNGFIHRFLSLARQINNEMPVYSAELALSFLINSGLPVKGSRVAVLGLAYKPDIDDCRESPSFKIISHLKQFGVKTAIFDPFIPEKSTVKTLEEAVAGAQLIIVATGHSEFQKLITPALIKKHGIIAVVDGRNCLNPKVFKSENIPYIGIGRGKIPENFIRSEMIANDHNIAKASC